jgi:hypothetical protein
MRRRWLVGAAFDFGRRLTALGTFCSDALLLRSPCGYRRFEYLTAFLILSTVKRRASQFVHKFILLFALYSLILSEGFREGNSRDHGDH